MIDAMNPTNLKVTSREYKLILNEDRFQEIDRGEIAFWHLVEFLINKSGGEIIERQEEIKTRMTWYIDTPDFTLKRKGWIVRLRNQKKKYKLTLKVRNSDRYVSASKNLKAVRPNGDDTERKFEEDILPPFTSKFSHSASMKLEDEPKLTRLRHLIEFFPGLGDLRLDNKTLLQIVNGFKAHETTRWSGQARVGNGHTIKACLSYWHPSKDRQGIPLIVEFSYDYDLSENARDRYVVGSHDLERFDVGTADTAATIFRSLQKQNGWVRFHATTKNGICLQCLLKQSSLGKLPDGLRKLRGC